MTNKIPFRALVTIAISAITLVLAPILLVSAQRSNANELSSLVKQDKTLLKQDTNTLSANAKEVPVYRLFNPNSKGAGSHHFTINSKEKSQLKSTGWKDEGIAYYAFSNTYRSPISPNLQNTALLRLYNPNSGEHLYTINQKEKNDLKNMGWNDEGVAYFVTKNDKFVDKSNQPASYRLYNPNSGEHFYTLSEKERKGLVGSGWKYEGVSFYTFPTKVSKLKITWLPKTGVHSRDIITIKGTGFFAKLETPTIYLATSYKCGITYISNTEIKCKVPDEIPVEKQQSIGLLVLYLTGESAKGKISYIPDPGKYTVTLDQNGGEKGQTKVVQSYGLKPKAIKPPTRKGYAISGWFDSKTGGNRILNSNGSSSLPVEGWIDSSGNWIRNTNNQTLYAMWVTGMQSFTKQQCDSMRIYESIRLTDVRNNQEYRIKKMRDSRCWMIDNLKIGDYENELYLNPDTSSFSVPVFVLPKVNSKDQEKYNDPAVVDPAGGTSENTEYCRTRTGRNGFPENSITGCGYLYNWNSTTVEMGRKNVKETNDSICPKGWRLPKGGIDGDFEMLNYAEGGDGSEWWIPTKGWEGVFSGYGSSASGGNPSFNDQEYHAFFWSSTARVSDLSKIYILTLYPHDASLFEYYQDRNHNGVAIRCIQNF
jgi:uncharacterized protein (TIGR02145 family)